MAPAPRYAAAVWLLGCQRLVDALSSQVKLAAIAKDPVGIESRPWMNTALEPDARASMLLAQMTQSEMIAMVHGDGGGDGYVGHIAGNTRLGIPELNLHDGPQGFRTAIGPAAAEGTSTSFPGGMAMAATWDDNAVHDWGVAMGKEFKMKGANVQLGPGLNLARVPLNGRNFEYTVGEDPLLGYRLSKSAVEGIQSQNVIATAKHWVVNSQETNRMSGTEDVDERTLFEVYYPPFEGAVDGGVGAVMCSYQRINGVYSCENAETLAGHLKKDLGFKGFVMSDWGATHTPSLRQGLDQEMPVAAQTNPMGLALQSMVTDGLALSATGTGLISTGRAADIHNATARILRTMFKHGTFDQPEGTWAGSKFLTNATTEDSARLARELGVKSTVLLKNEGVLPLPEGKKIALIGFAGANAISLAYGHGSGEVQPSYFVSPLDGIRGAAGADAEVVFNNGNDLEAAAELAKSADYAIVFVGSSASEGADRASLSLDKSCATSLLGMITLPCDGQDDQQNAMVDAVAAANPKTIVVASVPGAVLMPWSARVQAVLTNFMPGQQAGNALADILFGKANPVARLPITMPNGANDVGMTPSQWPGEPDSEGMYHSTYSEKLNVGYRMYEQKDIAFTTGFPFGHGLSYTTFQYSDLGIAKQGEAKDFAVTLEVRNAGKTPGAEVVQLYLTFPQEAGEPVKQLKGFQKTAVLAPGESVTVTLPLSVRALSVWDTALHNWSPVLGSFKALVGASSRDIRLEKVFDNL